MHFVTGKHNCSGFNLISLVFLEYRSHHHYGWINYNRNKNELSVIAQKIFDYQFKRENFEILDAANSKAILDYPQWQDRCKRLLYTFFSRDGTSSGIILFPDIEITVRSQIDQVQRWQRLMITLNDWCKLLSPNDPTGLIIRNYHLKDHLYFCGIKDDEIKNTLGFSSSAKIFNFQDSDKRFLVFNPPLKIILIIRLVESTKVKSKLLKKEVNHCIDEVNLLCFLLRDELKNTGVILTGLVAYSGDNPHSQSLCKHCDNIIFPFEIFNSGESFKRFFERFFNETKMKDFAKRVARNVTENKANVFQAVASKILGYLSHLQFEMLLEPILPVAEQDATDNIKQAELLLSCYQMEIAYSDDKRIWLEGNYGTGKTVVALKKIELLLKTLKEEEVIYYVNFARKSILDFKVKQRFEENMNVKAIRGVYSLSDTIKHQILPKERKRGNKNIHIVVDEYNSQDLSTKEVENLIPIFNKVEELINSTVLIAVQPIEINRVVKFCENGIERQFSETNHELDKLIKATGIKVRTLENVMRTTVEINNFAEITQEYLDNQSNRCVRRQQDHDVQSSFKVADLDLNPKMSKEVNVDSSFQNTSLESNYSVSVISVDSSDATTRTPPFEPEKLIDRDEIYKLVHTENVAGEENFQETVTSYSYTCPSQIGHSINGPLPQFIKFSKSADLCEQVALIAAVLDKIFDTKSNKTAIIHFEPDDPPLWLESLFQLKKISPSLTMTNETKEFLEDANENLVLVKNVNFLRGLEFPKVLLILDSDEHHLRHLIPEAIARCTSNLSILIRPPDQGIKKSDTVADLAEEWEKHLDDGILRMLEIGFCPKPSCNRKKVQREACCKVERLAGTYYGVHKNFKLYRYFLEEIRSKNIGNVQPEYKDKQKQAEAL